MKFIIKILFALLLTMEVFAQGGGSVALSDARSVALGKTYTISSRGINSIGINPANLAIETGRTVELKTIFPVPNLSYIVGNDFFSIEDYNYFFSGTTDANGEKTGKTLTDDEKQQFKDLFSNGSALYTEFNLPIFSVVVNAGEKIGSFGFSMSDKAALKVDIPTAMFDIFLDGIRKGGLYSLDDLDIQSWYIREYSLSYARKLPKLFPKYVDNINVGVSLKLVQGFAYAGIEQLNTFITIDETNNSVTVNSDVIANMAFSPNLGVKYDFEPDSLDKESDVGPFMTPAGTGVGFDLGISADVNEQLSVGFAITDMGSITWDTEAAEYVTTTPVYTFNDITDQELVDSLRDAVVGEGKFVESFSTGLPTALRLGAMYKFNYKFPMMVAVDYNQGFNNLPGNSKQPRFSIGYEVHPLSWLPVRTGFSFGGRAGFGWGFGIGFNASFLEINLATSSMNSFVAGNSAKIVGFALGSRWKF